jgi:5,10-methylenetetrahydrofolate reductase
VEKVANAIKEMENIYQLNIPEIVEENHEGLPYYRNKDTREFGVELRDICKKDVMVNTIVVHHQTKDTFERWIIESLDKFKIKNFVFVGAKTQYIKYRGPNVLEANAIAKNKKVNFGNIFIPERKEEAKRLLAKTISGCSFFTSQVLFNADKVIDILTEYSIRCEKANVKPAKFFLSFSPLSTPDDITFIKWLGANIGENTEKRLRKAQNMGEESNRIITDVWKKVIDASSSLKSKISLGVNIEYIKLHNLDISKQLVHSISEI